MLCPSSIYQYFSDKETIILSLAEHFMEKIHIIVDKHIRALVTIEELDSVMLGRQNSSKRSMLIQLCRVSLTILNLNKQRRRYSRS